MFHRLPERIKAHLSLCFMALIVYRVMRHRLKLAGSRMSPDAALDRLRRIQLHSVSINAGTPVLRASTINEEQAEVFAAPRLKEPKNDAQLTGSRAACTGSTFCRDRLQAKSGAW